LDQKVLQPLLLGPARSNQLKKPVLIIAVTDGAPGGEARDTLTYVSFSLTLNLGTRADDEKITGCACSRVIKNAKQQLMNSRYGEDALSMQLAMVGNDMGARKFLEGQSPSESCEKFRREEIVRRSRLILPFV